MRDNRDVINSCAVLGAVVLAVLAPLKLLVLAGRRISGSRPTEMRSSLRQRARTHRRRHIGHSRVPRGARAFDGSPGYFCGMYAWYSV